MWPAQIAGLASAEFSTVVDSDVPLIVDRTMKWDSRGYGAHAETAVPGAATVWYLAEGATHSGFDLFYLLQNASATEAAEVEIRYLLPAPAPPLARHYTVAPASRANVWVDLEEGWHSTDVSADRHGHQRSANHRRAGDVLRHARAPVRRGPRERRHHRAGDALVPR